MDATSALILGAVPFLAGVGILLYVWRCWSGRSRRWATRAFTNQMVYALLPGMGAILVAFAVKVVFGDPLGNLLMAVAVVVCFLGLVALIFEPRWWGPRWYHDLQASNPQPDLQDPLTAVVTSAAVPAPFSSRLKQPGHSQGIRGDAGCPVARHLRPRPGHPPSRARPWRARSGWRPSGPVSGWAHLRRQRHRGQPA
jgi:hypothetical protein